MLDIPRIYALAGVTLKDKDFQQALRDFKLAVGNSGLVGIPARRLEVIVAAYVKKWTSRQAKNAEARQTPKVEWHRNQ
jgi:hypothetical protein